MLNIGTNVELTTKLKILGDIYPADGTPREHEASGINHDAEHGDDAEGFIAEGHSHAEGSDGHAERAGDEQRLAAQLLDGEHSHEGEGDVHDAHDDGLHHWVVHAHIGEDTRSIVEHGIDADGLLEYAEHYANEDADEAVGEEFLTLLGHGVLDVVEDVNGLRISIDAREDVQRLLVLTGHGQITWSLRHEADEQGEETCGHHFG